MKKKIWKYLLAICMFAGAFIFMNYGSVEVWAYEECGDYEYEELDDQTVSIYRYRGTESVVSIPSMLDGKKVTEIGNMAFNQCKNVSRVTVPAGVTSIGEWAFSSCENLSDIVLPYGVISIGEYAFNNCESLSNIELPSSIASIGGHAFQNCKALCNIEIPSGVTIIGDYTFCGCSRLSDITLPSGIVSIGESAFQQCDSLESVILPEGIKSIGKCAFYDSSIDSISISDKVTYIGDSAFSGCKNILDIVIPDSVTYLGSSAFSQCNKLKTISLPGSIAVINPWTFDNCHSLTNLVIPDGITAIEERAFSYCNKLADITFPGSVTSIGDRAFGNCASLSTVCLPSGISSLGDGVFAGCSAEIMIDVKNSSYIVENHILYDAEKTEVKYCSVEKEGEIELPESVITIGGYAFAYCNGISSIKIPGGVTKIGLGTFICNSKLKDIWYGADKLHWGKIFVDEYNYALSNVTIHCTDGVYTPADYKPENPGEGNQTPDSGTTHPDTGTTSPEAGTSTSDPNSQITGPTPQTPEQANITLSSKNVQLSKSNVTYNGKAQKPSVIVKNNDGSRIEPANYTVSYANNKNVGQATVTVKFSGNYQGTVKKTFNIIPKGTTISKVTAKKKGLSVKWKKQTTQTTGYEIQYSTSSKFKGAKKAGNIKAKTTSKSISKLKAKKKYYVRIRTYKTVKSKKYYSSWSKSKSVITKK